MLSLARVQAINLSGELREVQFAGQTVTTGFSKSAVNGAVFAHALGMEGDAQGDLSVHGGLGKAVYLWIWTITASRCSARYVASPKV